MYLKIKEHEKTEMEWNNIVDWNKGNQMKTKKTLPISDPFDNYGAFFKFNEVKATLLVKKNMEILVPQYQPPMLDVMSWLQNILNRSPVHTNRAFIIKRGDLCLNPLLQLKPDKLKVREHKKTK